jgi:predicted nuclease of predicted toxin-antitoxin system
MEARVRRGRALSRVIVALYFDHNVDKEVAIQLRRRGVDVLRLQEDGRERARDVDVVTRATELSRVVVTHDADFIGIAGRYQRSGQGFSGVILVRQASRQIGHVVTSLEVLVKAGSPEDFADRVTYT